MYKLFLPKVLAENKYEASRLRETSRECESMLMLHDLALAHWLAAFLYRSDVRFPFSQNDNNGRCAVLRMAGRPWQRAPHSRLRRLAAVLLSSHAKRCNVTLFTAEARLTFVSFFVAWRMKIAVVGCVHGSLDKVYEDVALQAKEQNTEIDLVLICGDFQAIRNVNDLKCMAVPDKYKSLGTFHEYYSGARKAPYLTGIIGGNHEASNYFSCLPYGGWVAPNIYYFGYSNVIRFGGLRIAAISGIHKPHDTQLGHFERLPYDNSTLRSVFHTRALEAYRMIQIRNDKTPQPIDIVLSHDWPLNIHTCGNVRWLLTKKPFFKQDVQNNALGNPLYQPVVPHLKPRYWFSAHLHVRFEASIDFGDNVKTNFLALDKCLPRRHYLEIIDIAPDGNEDASKVFEYDPEWLCILKKTNKYVSVEKHPRVKVPATWITVDPTSDEEIKEMIEVFGNDLKVPENFAMAEPVPSADKDSDPRRVTNFANPQSVEFCTKLFITDPISAILANENTPNPGPLGNPDKIDLSGDEWEDEPGEIESHEEIIKRLRTDTTETVDEEAKPLFFIDTKGKQ